MNDISLEELLKAKDLDKKIGGLKFEQGVKLLEELVARVEAGNLSLENSVLSYEQGVKLVKHLRKLLSGAEEKLQLLSSEGVEDFTESV